MRYGFLEGEVEHVLPNAIIDETRGLVYPGRVEVTGSSLRTERLGIYGNSSRLPSVQAANTSDRAGADDLTKDQVWDRDVIEQDKLNSALEITQIGMAVTGEVKTSTRSVPSYPLSHIAKATSEAGRER